MEKVVEKTVRSCDFCKKEDGCYYKCLGCNKDVCWDCKETVGILYYHSVYFSGGGDGFYCHDCDSTCQNDLHSAYKKIKYLRAELDAFNKEFTERYKSAENWLKRLNRNQT